MRSYVFAFVAIIALATTAHAQPASPFPSSYEVPTEKITRYDSRIVVDAAGNLDVTETIHVIALGQAINHGIYRDFPTKYRATGSFMGKTVPFVVKETTLDGAPVAHKLASMDNGVRVYLGSASSVVTHGPHVYTIRYHTAFQLGFFEDHDELYWNVTGNGWMFPIEAVSATVTLPRGDGSAQPFRAEAYAGPQGSTRSIGIESSVDGATGKFIFATTFPLMPEEGLTIVASFPKGIVAEPTLWQRIAADPSLLVGAGGTVLLLLYFFFMWTFTGRDPNRGTVIPLYGPPHDLSPGAVRYVLEMGYDERCFTAAILNLAVKGHVRIKKSGDVYSLERTGGDAKPITGGEAQIREILLAGGDTFTFKNNAHATIVRARRQCEVSAAGEASVAPFDLNIQWTVLGALGALIVILVMLGTSPFVADILMPTLIFSGSMALLSFVIIKSSLRGDLTAMRIGVLVVCACLAFIVVGALVLTNVLPLTFAVVITILLVSLAVFSELIKQPSVEARRVMDSIEGFRMYLRTAEKDRLNAEFAAANPAGPAPERTIALFEAFLPYAFALEVENEWAEQFADVIAAVANVQGGQPYQPLWYVGGSGFDTRHMGTAVGDFGSGLNRTISAAATPPGSSSGSSFSSGGGGGFSGGGGGGGGGGGW